MNKVHVSWKIPDIAATVTVDKKWNTETLAWDTVNTADKAEAFVNSAVADRKNTPETQTKQTFGTYTVTIKIVFS